MQVRQILRDKGSEVVAIGAEASLSEAARLLSRRRIGAVVVKDSQGGLVGILSERDVVRAISEESVGALAKPVANYMTGHVATCTEFDHVDELMEMMTRGRFRHIPVLDEDEHLIGIISIGDVVKTRIAETVQEAQSLREYISA